jgi:hypothetical protein
VSAEDVRDVALQRDITKGPAEEEREMKEEEGHSTREKVEEVKEAPSEEERTKGEGEERLGGGVWVSVVVVRVRVPEEMVRREKWMEMVSEGL